MVVGFSVVVVVVVVVDARSPEPLPKLRPVGILRECSSSSSGSMSVGKLALLTIRSSGSERRNRSFILA